MLNYQFKIQRCLEIKLTTVILFLFLFIFHDLEGFKDSLNMWKINLLQVDCRPHCLCPTLFTFT